MRSTPVLLLTLFFSLLSVVEHGKPPKFPLFQHKEPVEIVTTLRPEGDA